MLKSRVFISHSTANADVALLIHSTLSNLGLSVFVDREAISPGESIVSAIDRALAEADYVLLLWSAQAQASSWVEAERDAAFFRDRAGETILLVVRLDDTPLPTLLAARRYFPQSTTRTKNLEAIEHFFIDELARSGDRRMRGWHTPPPTNPLAGGNRREIRLVAQRCLREQDLRSFMFDHEIDPSGLQGESLGERIVSLLHETDASLGLEAFVEWLHAERGLCVQRTVQTLRPT